MKIVALVIIAFIALLLYMYLFIQQRKWKRLVSEGITVPGVIDSIKTEQYNQVTWYRLLVDYEVNGKRYQNKQFITRKPVYAAGQGTHVRCLADAPAFSAVTETDDYIRKPTDMKNLSFFVIGIFLVMAVSILSYPNTKKALVIVFAVILFVLSVCNFLHERMLAEKGSVCKGRIVFTDIASGMATVSAEYTVDGALFTAPDCKMPASAQHFQVGDEIKIRFLQDKPFFSRSAENTDAFKKAKILLVVGILLIPAAILIFFLL